jgi:ABC-type glycerol-3-phosphate transport system substrate-binding protein
VLRHIICLSAGIAFLATAPFAGSTDAQAQEQIRWATSSVGSSGHRALVALATLLNREQDDYEITVLPTPGAAASVRGFSAGQFDGYYGADVAYHEIANQEGRYRDFDPAGRHPAGPVLLVVHPGDRARDFRRAQRSVHRLARPRGRGGVHRARTVGYARRAGTRPERPQRRP